MKPLELLVVASVVQMLFAIAVLLGVATARRRSVLVSLRVVEYLSHESLVMRCEVDIVVRREQCGGQQRRGYVGGQRAGWC